MKGYPPCPTLCSPSSAAFFSQLSSFPPVFKNSPPLKALPVTSHPSAFPAGTALAWAAAIFEVVAGIAILVGFQTKYAALALAAFCVFTGLVFHGGADQMQQIMMFKNIGLAGGFLALAVAGAGAWSVDAKRGLAA